MSILLTATHMRVWAGASSKACPSPLFSCSNRVLATVVPEGHAKKFYGQDYASDLMSWQIAFCKSWWLPITSWDLDFAVTLGILSEVNI